ncbi:hypothetical protein Zmor_013055 [Zophobas morio]|uniref:Uncharacterized protein n=1 Tax=Zophobas morio TaxID=2755281 RepID=A0AA38IEZ2_9CUCU|nr:hypothetical protein Zmor_013055 [Zophobas morio]
MTTSSNSTTYWRCNGDEVARMTILPNLPPPGERARVGERFAKICLEQSSNDGGIILGYSRHYDDEYEFRAFLPSSCLTT